MRAATAEVGELHAVTAAHACVHAQHPAGKPVGRQPFAHGVWVQKGAVDALCRGAQHAVQGDGTGVGVGRHARVSLGRRSVVDESVNRQTISVIQRVHTPTTNGPARFRHAAVATANFLAKPQPFRPQPSAPQSSRCPAPRPAAGQCWGACRGRCAHRLHARHTTPAPGWRPQA